MKKLYNIVLIFLMISLVSASSMTFKQNEEINYRFRCFDENGNYCLSGTILVINIEYPNGSNALDNETLTYQSTYFNITLPTDALGINYHSLITSTTSNNTVTEFTYDVTPSGILQNIGILITFIILVTILFILSFYKIFNSNSKVEFIIFSILSYFLFLVFMFMSWKISENYLYTMEWIVSLLYIMFLIVLILMFPFIIFLVLYLFYNIFTEKNMKEMTDMGYSPEEAKRYK